MAVKDHSLDQKIIDSAKQEFMKFGFDKASLRVIAKNAGITSGALYTRYDSKDDLFSSLLKPLMTNMKEETSHIARMYTKAFLLNKPEAIIKAIKNEQRFALELLFKHYDECVLLICKSHGSVVEKMLDEAVENKVKETVHYINTLAKVKIDLSGIEFIMEQQFFYYKKILEKGYDKKQAYKTMENIFSFQEAGFRDLFNKIM